MASILIVDDAKFMRLTLANILAKTEHTIIGEAENGEEAVQLYRTYQPELVIMDITMPKLNGIEALKIIKTEFPKANVIMCSSIGQQRLVIEAIEAGARDFIVKPFEESQILEVVQQRTI